MKNPFTNSRIICTDCSTDDYLQYGKPEEKQRGHKAFIMSKSALVKFAACPRKWMAAGAPADDDETAATEWGSLIDCLVMQPSTFNSRFAVQPEFYPAPKSHQKVKQGKIKEGDPLPWNANATICDDWKMQQGGKTIISHDTYDQAQYAVVRLFEDEVVKEFIHSSIVQVFVLCEYVDEETKIVVPIKCLLDLVPAYKNARFGKCLGDFKTARNAACRAYQKAIYENTYHVQGVMYLDAYRAAVPQEDRCEFRHIVQENEPPFEVGKRIISSNESREAPGFLEIGREYYLSALRLYCQCLKENRWPGYDNNESAVDGFSIMEPEAWMLK